MGLVISDESLGWQEVLPVNLAGTPFILCDNYFIAVGCNTRASLWTKNGSTEHIGCDSICSNGSSISNWLENGACSGKECCQDMDLPPLLQIFKSSFVSKEGKQGSDGLKLAFLADPYWFDSEIRSPQEIYKLSSIVPVSLVCILNNNSWTYNKNIMDCYVFWKINSKTIMANK